MNTIESFALQVAIGGLLVSALALAVARLLRRRSEPLRYGILLTGVIGVLAVPALVGLGRACQSALPAVEPVEEIVKVSVDMLPALLDRPNADPPIAEPDAPDTRAAWLAASALLSLWLLGSLAGMVRLVRALVKQRRALIGQPWCPDFWTADRRSLLARTLGLRRFPAVHVSPVVPMPMVIGIFRPTIVLPEAAPPSWQQPQWEAVLLHEAAHIARGDPWAVLAQRLAIVLFWWCPPVYALARRLDALRENICDDCALEGCCDRFAYAELLVDSAEHFLRLTAFPAPLGLLDSARGGLEARVSRLLRQEKPTMTRLSLPGKLLGALCLVMVGLVTTGGTAFSGGQDPPPRKVQIKIIIDGKEIDLSDPKVWQHIEAAQKKAVEVQVQTFKALQAATGGKPATGADAVAGVVRELAFSPDGKLLATGDGKHIIVIDAATGKVLAQREKANPGAAQQQYQVQFRTDPRIEALVKQAEAIKPGSGNAIRQALQGGDPKAGDIYKRTEVRSVKPVPGTSTLRLWHEDGKKVIVDIGDGKTLRLNLNTDDLHKLLQKEVQLQLHLDLQKDKKGDEKARATELLLKLAKDKSGSGRPARQQPPADLEALSRQLERLSAELNELRKHLPDTKK